ncbi:Dyp-type peroxidase [Streptomyces sp. NPDC001658]
MPKATDAGFNTLDVIYDSAPARRSVLAAAGAGLAATACTRADGDPAGRRGPGRHGARQDGVTTAQQRNALVLAHDLDPALRGAEGVRALKTVLWGWSRVLADGGRPASLTATVGIGPRLPARLGLPVPAGLRELPPFPGDRLDPAHCGGDLIVQLCADDARILRRTALRLAEEEPLRPRWSQAGFLPPAPPGATPRNLLGFKDGSSNPTPEECERWVWKGNATFLVVRRVHLRVAEFGRLATDRQEAVIGRRRADGAPLGGGREEDEVDIFAKTERGRYVTPLGSHARAASPRLDAGARMLRRGYSYDNGPDDRGLLFLAFMRDPNLFVRVQRRMAAQDELSRFSEHRGSALAYVLPGAPRGERLGAGFLP